MGRMECRLRLTMLSHPAQALVAHPRRMNEKTAAWMSGGSTMSRWTVALFVAWFAVSLAQAQTVPLPETVFKCVRKNEPDRYQNFPCPPESLSSSVRGDTQTSARPARGALSSSPRRSAEYRVETAPSVATSRSVAPREASSQLLGQLRVGMTTQEVKAVWGEPAEIVQEEVVDGRLQTWSYGSSGSLQFNASGHLEAVQ